MSGAVLHAIFDVIAWAAAGLSIYWVTRRAGSQFPVSPAGDWHYIAVLVFGAGVGAVAFGTANLWLSQQSGLARSIEGDPSACSGALLPNLLWRAASPAFECVAKRADRLIAQKPGYSRYR
jgi:hypothetical protein